MIINEAGEYTLQYTATDACGNSTTVERDLTVLPPPRTVLYTDGTFIINERPQDIEANIQAHGQPTNIYAPLDPNGATDVDKYIFSQNNQRPWYSVVASVSAVEIGSNVSPTSTAFWFLGMTACTSIDLTKLDTSAVTDMKSMFNNCKALTSLDVSGFDTGSVTDMQSMFYSCQALTSIDVSGFDTSATTKMTEMFRTCKALTSLDVSSFDTSSVTDMRYMFNACNALTTIYASNNFVVSQVTSSADMFYLSANLVGGAGTTYSSAGVDKTYAHIDGGVSDPGYFTAKS